MDIKGELNAEQSWGPPQYPYPYPSMQLGRSGKGGGRRAPLLLNHTRPHALTWGGAGAGGLPPKAPCPHVDGDKGHNPGRWLWRSADGG
ncbi:unnamed protein product, partial [Staurois parvus]